MSPSVSRTSFETVDKCRQRRSPAHPPPTRRHNAPVVVLLTVCVRDRTDRLANHIVHASLRDVWCASREWAVGDYVLMPDHLHLFCRPAVHDPEPIQKWIRFWKQSVSRTCPELLGAWLRDGWDTQMRDRLHYEKKLSYVRMNPVRAGLIAEPSAWPYTGVVSPITWL